MKNRRMIVISALLLYAIAVVACLLMEAKGRAEPVIECDPPMGAMLTDLDFKVCKGNYVITGAVCTTANTIKCDACRIVASKTSGTLRCYAIQCTLGKNPQKIQYKVCVKGTGTCSMIDVKDVNCGQDCKINECNVITGGACTACECDMDHGIDVSQQTQVNTCS